MNCFYDHARAHTLAHTEISILLSISGNLLQFSLPPDTITAAI